MQKGSLNRQSRERHRTGSSVGDGFHQMTSCAESLMRSVAAPVAGRDQPRDFDYRPDPARGVTLRAVTLRAWTLRAL